MIRIAGYPAINTGALVKVRRTGHTLHLEIVEASAASHVAPRYEMAAEAPRIYGDYTMKEVKSAWIEWIADMIDSERMAPFESDAEARRWIEIHLDCIPEFA